jgi:pimeloyl-ACP methyl ester carboxylesterase
MALPAAGSALPAFSIQSAVSDRDISPAALKGKRAVLVVHGQKSSDAAKDASKAIRARFKPSEVFAVSIVDLRAFGGLWKRVAEAQVKATYEKLAGKVKESDPGADPADWVVICPDWDGSVCAALGVDAPDDVPAAIVVGPDGKVVGVASGAGLGEKVMGLLG